LFLSKKVSGMIQIRIRFSVLIQSRIRIRNTGFNQFYCCRIEPATVEYVDEQEIHPGTEQQGLPGTVQQGLPGTVQQGLPGTVQPGLPGTVQQGLPGAVQHGLAVTEQASYHLYLSTEHDIFSRSIH
jgi:hypothetical protein